MQSNPATLPLLVGRPTTMDQFSLGRAAHCDEEKFLLFIAIPKDGTCLQEAGKKLQNEIYSNLLPLFF